MLNLTNKKINYGKVKVRKKAVTKDQYNWVHVFKTGNVPVQIHRNEVWDKTIQSEIPAPQILR